MKAISLHQPWASAITYLDIRRDILLRHGITAQKTIEVRTWSTDYRGPLLIVSTKKPKIMGLPLGKAVCTCEIIGCRLMDRSDEYRAQCRWEPRAFAWLLTNIVPTEPFQVKGQQGFYEVDYEG